jgi:hypothetical protein
MKKNVVFAVILAAFVAAAFIPTPAGACNWYCHPSGECRFSITVTWMYCSNWGGACIESQAEGCALAALPSDATGLTQEAFVASLVGKTSASSPAPAVVACSVESN